MKKLFAYTFTLLFISTAISQISVDETFTVQEIVEDILIDNTCAETSNFEAVTGSDFGNNPNGIGVFFANDSDFPYSSGVILSSGAVAEAPGPNSDVTIDSGDATWPGDLDLQANTTATNTNNASYIQFDFVPPVNAISFNFIMASEEYNQVFECVFSDAFAFILTNQNTGISQNLAVLPNTEIPIEVTNIHPFVPQSANSEGCAPINEVYFDKYNFIPFNDPESAAIAYDGQITSLKAEGDVIVGDTYTIKIVVADSEDSSFDTAIFLEAGSFSLGSDLGEDLTISGGNALCSDQGDFEIGVVPDSTGNTQYKWFEFNLTTNDFEEIPGETNPSLIVNSSNTYRIEVSLTNGCSLTDDIIVEYAPPVFATSPGSFIVCDTIENDGFTTINFTNTSLISEILNGQDPDIFNVTFYANNTDAQNGTNALSLTTYTNISNPQTISARVTVGNPDCFAITDFTLTVSDAPLIILPETFRLCVDSSNQVIPEEEGERSPPIIETGLNASENTFQWFLNDEILSNETSPELTVNQAGVYSVLITNLDTLCFNEFSTTVFSSSPPTNVTAALISDVFDSNNIIEVSAEGSNSIIYSLDDGPFQESNIFENVSGGIHTITAKDSNGCGETTISLFVVFFRPFFTPNGDGYNDTWNLDGLNDLDPNAIIRIFDQFGKLLLEMKPSGPGWNGEYNGRPLFSDDYWFVANYIENGVQKNFRSHVTLKR